MASLPCAVSSVFASELVIPTLHKTPITCGANAFTAVGVNQLVTTATAAAAESSSVASPSEPPSTLSLEGAHPRGKSFKRAARQAAIAAEAARGTPALTNVARWSPSSFAPLLGSSCGITATTAMEHLYAVSGTVAALCCDVSDLRLGETILYTDEDEKVHTNKTDALCAALVTADAGLLGLLAVLRPPRPASVGIVIPVPFKIPFHEFPFAPLCHLLTIAGHRRSAVGPPPEYSVAMVPKKRFQPESTITIEVFIPLLQRSGPRYLGGPLVHDLHAPSLGAISNALVPLLAAATAALAALRLTTGITWDAKTSRILGALSSAAAAMDGLLAELGSTTHTLLSGLAAVLHRVCAQHASWRAEVDGWLTVPWAKTVLLGPSRWACPFRMTPPSPSPGQAPPPPQHTPRPRTASLRKSGSCLGDTSDYQEGEDLLPGGSNWDDGASEGSG